MSIFSESAVKGLILDAYQSNQAIATHKKIIPGIKKKLKFDAVVSRAATPTDDELYSFWIIKPSKAHSGAVLLTGLALKDAVGAALKTAALGSGSIASSSNGVKAVRYNHCAKVGKGQFAEHNALKIGGQMQLHAAKKMGKDVYDLVRVWGLTAHRYHGGIAKLTPVQGKQLGVQVDLYIWPGNAAAEQHDRIHCRTGSGNPQRELDLMITRPDCIKASKFYDAVLNNSAVA